MERLEFTRKFVEGVGWVVDERQPGAQAKVGALPVQMNPPPPPLPVSLENIPYDLAVQVVKNSGMFVVPLEFLTEEAKEEMLKADFTPENKEPEAAKPTAAELIEKIKLARTLDEITDIIGTDTRKTVIAAAETKAAELTQGE